MSAKVEKFLEMKQAIKDSQSTLERLKASVKEAREAKAKAEEFHAHRCAEAFAEGKEMPAKPDEIAAIEARIASLESAAPKFEKKIKDASIELCGLVNEQASCRADISNDIAKRIAKKAEEKLAEAMILFIVSRGPNSSPERGDFDQLHTFNEAVRVFRRDHSSLLGGYGMAGFQTAFSRVCQSLTKNPSLQSVDEFLSVESGFNDLVKLSGESIEEISSEIATAKTSEETSSEGQSAESNEEISSEGQSAESNEEISSEGQSAESSEEISSEGQSDENSEVENAENPGKPARKSRKAKAE